MTGWRRLTRKIIVLGGVLCLAAVAAFHPEGQWRVRLVSLKLAHKLPQVAWADLAIGSVPGSSRLNKVREMVTPIWPCWIEKLDLSLEESNEQDWRAYSVFNRPTAITKNLESHVSFLSAGHTPHPPHQHPEEELILVLSGEVEIIRAHDPSWQRHTTEKVGPRSVVYHHSGQYHTVRGVGPEPAIYLVLSWRGEPRNTEQSVLQSSTFDLNPAFVSQLNNPDDMSSPRIFESPTLYLHKLHCHITVLKPGAGYPPHEDPHEVAIFTVDGTVETLGQRVGPNSVIFYAADEPHGMKNVGATPATYVVFEFHGSHPRSH